ncbi:hypothetical protein [Rosistilla oblonga]|uniref:hypothetical protein n=1 Tax=Rosistilla oblonga TaxID=2527990 RepID=UPI003A973271
MMRKTLINRSAISVFFLSHLVFVFIGVLLLPWVQPIMGEHIAIGQSKMSINLFAHIPFWVFSQQDYTRGIVLTVGGACIVLASYLSSNHILGSQQLKTCDRRDEKPASIIVDLHISRLYFISGFCLLMAALFATRNIGAYYHGLTVGILQGNPPAIIDARREVGDNFAMVLLSLSIVPFFSVVLWLLNQSKPGHRRTWYPRIYLVAAILLLVLTFQKRPLIVFIAILFFATRWLKSSQSNTRNFDLALLLRKRIVDVMVLGGLFGVVMLFYIAFSNYGRNGESIFDAVFGIAIVAGSRIVFRLATPGVMYAHYFPNVDGHYGFTNIGLFSKIFGFERYADTQAIFAYCGGDGGGTAVCTLVDMYGGFSFYGWAAGSVLIGILLSRLDQFLISLSRRRSVLSIAITAFAFLSVYYMSQASIFRTLNGYGALWFALCGLILHKSAKSVDIRRKRRPTAPMIAQSRNASEFQTASCE